MTASTLSTPQTARATSVTVPIVGRSAVPASMANGAVAVIGRSAVPASMATGNPAVPVTGHSAVPASMATGGRRAGRGRISRPAATLSSRPLASH